MSEIPELLRNSASATTETGRKGRPDSSKAGELTTTTRVKGMKNIFLLSKVK